MTTDPRLEALVEKACRSARKWQAEANGADPIPLLRSMLAEAMEAGRCSVSPPEHVRIAEQFGFREGMMTECPCVEPNGPNPGKCDLCHGTGRIRRELAGVLWTADKYVEDCIGSRYEGEDFKAIAYEKFGAKAEVKP